MNLNLDVSQVSALADDLDLEAGTVARGKVYNIVRRAGVEIREEWKETATEFPSPTRKREHDYAIDFDRVRGNADSVSVTVGSDDPLLAVVEYGSTNHSAHLYGNRALEAAADGAVDALGQINPLHSGGRK